MRLKQAKVMSPQYRISQKHSFIEKKINSILNTYVQYVQNLQKQNIKLRPTVNVADHLITKKIKLNTNKSNLHYVQIEAV